MAMTLGQLASKFRRAAQETDQEMQQNLARFVQVGVGTMKKAIQNRHAVDTGTMLNSTTAEKTGESEYLIGPTVEYAAFVALGTSRTKARPFHIDAAKEMAKQAPDFGLKLGGL